MGLKIFRILKLWPLPVAIYFATGFNLMAIFGFLKFLGVTGITYWLIGIASSQCELCFWYWFWGKFPRMVKEADVVQELIDDFKKKKFPLMFQGLADHAKWVVQVSWTWVRARFEMQDNGWVDRIVCAIHKSFAPVGYLLICILGMVPNWNIIFGAPVCRIVRLRFALGVLMLGNINTVFVSGGIVELLFWFWRDYPVLLVFGGVVLGAGILIYHRISAKKT